MSLNNKKVNSVWKLSTYRGLFWGTNIMKKTVRKAIIPAAGLGTRFLPATKSQPKEMLPIVVKPTLQYIIEEAIESGIEEI